MGLDRKSIWVYRVMQGLYGANGKAKLVSVLISWSQDVVFDGVGVRVCKG